LRDLEIPPISNILTEHVAKTVALARKNFMFADTPAGATSSALIYSILESSKGEQTQPAPLHDGGAG